MCKIYFLSPVFLFMVSALSAQSPGGVNASLTAWIKADAATTLSSSDSLDAWTYANDITKQFTASTPSRPLVVSGAINFLPVVNFSGNKLMDGPAGADAPITAGNPAYCVFAVWRSTLDNNFQRVWSQRHFGGSASGDGFALASWNDNRFGDQLEAGPYDQALLQSYTAGKWNITQLNLLNLPTNDFEMRDPLNINGAPLSTTTIAGGGGSRFISDVSSRLGARDNNTEETLTGDIAELIVYNASVTDATQRNQVFSYLALKYGLHKAGDFIASDGTTITWDSTANSLYDHSVFGIGQDDNAGLLIARSNSIETGNGDGTGQGGKGNIVLSGATSQSNGAFLLIGNDDGALSETNSDLPGTADASTRRLAREWKVQHTGNLGTVNLDVDFTGISTSGVIGTTTDFYLMIDDDGDGDFTTGHTSYFAPSGFTGQVANFTGITLNNNVVFTLVTLASPATLPVTWTSFTATAATSSVLLNWSVENNEQGKSFEIEHSTDGIHFISIGKISNEVNMKNYSFTHGNVAGGLHYYRIYQSDINGTSSYSKTVTASIKAADITARLISNPVQNGSAAIEITTAKPVTIAIEIWSAAGVQILSRQQVVNAGTSKLVLPMAHIAAGNYVLKIKAGNGSQTMRLVKL